MSVPSLLERAEESTAGEGSDETTQEAREIRAAAPRVVIEGVASSAGESAAAIEEGVAMECGAFGRVLDAEFVPPRTVTVYFDSEAAAVSCAWRLRSSRGAALPSRPSASSPSRPWVEVRVTFFAAEDAPGDVAAAVGQECALYGRVLDAVAEAGAVRVALATKTGAAAAVVGVDGTAFDSKTPVQAGVLGGGENPPSATLGGLGDDDTLEEEEKDEDDKAVVVSEFAAECSRFGEVLGARGLEGGRVQVDFATSRQAAACAAAMHGRVFDGKTLDATFRIRGGADDLDAAFANDLWNALAERQDHVLATTQDSKQPKNGAVASSNGAASNGAASTSSQEQRRAKLGKAITKLRAATLKAPKDEKAKANLAGALLRVGGYENAVEALDYAQAAVELAPKWGWAHFRKGSALLALGEVAKAATSLKLAASLEPGNAQFAGTAAEAAKAASEILDPLDAYVATTVQAEAAKDLVDAADAEKRSRADLKDEASNKKRRRLLNRGKKGDSDDSDDENEGMSYNPRAHCYICKQWGHSKRDCPMARCQYCHELGHKKSECPLFGAALANAAEEEKLAKRKAFYEKKKARRKEEWTALLRQQSGIEGFAALYRVLGLPERRLATAADIKKAYHRRSLEYHPDKHPTRREEAHERFLEIKAAYELLLEGMETGGEGMHGAVFSAGELTDAAAAKALQDKVNNLAEKVSKNREWAG